MAYEIESHSTDQATPSKQPDILRAEPMVIDPYRMGSRSKAPSLNGQLDISKSTAAPQAREVTQAKPAAPSAPEDTVKLSPDASAVAKKEQQFRARQAQFEKERAAFESDKAELAQHRAFKQKLTQKDFAVLDGLVDYNDYSQFEVSKANGADPVQDEIKKLHSKVTDIEKRTQENVEKQYTAAVNERKIAAKKLIETSSDYPSIKKADALLPGGAHDVIVQHILDSWEENPDQELSIEQAAKEVEEVLQERAKLWASILEDTKPMEQPAPVKKPLPPLKTITNQVTASEATRAVKSFHDMNDHERYQEARKRAEEKLRTMSMGR